VWTFSIYLTEADGARLKALTEENLGKKVAMVLDEEVVCAPKVLAPITTGSFLIRTDDPALAQRLKSGLAGIQREAQ
jgi:preprotein translocase subunit SecD